MEDPSTAAKAKCSTPCHCCNETSVLVASGKRQAIIHRKSTAPCGGHPKSCREKTVVQQCAKYSPTNDLISSYPNLKSKLTDLIDDLPKQLESENRPPVLDLLIVIFTPSFTKSKSS